MPSDVDPPSGKREQISLEALRLDAENPRFGQVGASAPDQKSILNYIVEQFGVDDLLSSLSVNGYFSAEPIVVTAGPRGKFTVVEGNRRVAACLILTDDLRAADQGARRQRFRKLHIANGEPPLDPVPAIVYARGAQRAELLAYLGVRHIASSQSWDSYAKAAWVSQVVADGTLDVSTVAAMIGDSHGTVARLLEGFHCAKQVIECGTFVPENSQRRGRGSNPSYPFSWVYNVLSYSGSRRFVGLSPEKVEARDPIPDDHIEDAGFLFELLFGDASKGRSAAISDSRELSALAKALAEPEKVLRLRRGESLEHVVRRLQPLNRRLEDALTEVLDTLSDLLRRIDEDGVPTVPTAHVDRAKRVARLARTLAERLAQDPGEE